MSYNCYGHNESPIDVETSKWPFNEEQNVYITSKYLPTLQISYS